MLTASVDYFTFSPFALLRMKRTTHCLNIFSTEYITIYFIKPDEVMLALVKVAGKFWRGLVNPPQEFSIHTHRSESLLAKGDRFQITFRIFKNLTGKWVHPPRSKTAFVGR